MLTVNTHTDQQAVPPLTLGWRLRMSLENAGIQVSEMADNIESHRTTLTRWLHDEIVPKRIYLEKWAELTGVPYSWFEEALPAAPKTAAAPAAKQASITTAAQHKTRRRRSPSTRWNVECNIDDRMNIWERRPKIAVDAAA
jgi:transcriptional regulator with XRE-family HTH domain